MLELTQKIGSHCKGVVTGDGKGLVIYSDDTNCIRRVYRADMRDKKGVCGRGWSLVIPEKTHGRLTFSDGRLTRFAATDGKSFDFFYSDDLLCYIATEKGPITFDYNADGVLTCVCYPDGERVHYSYRDVFSVSDITVSDKNGGVYATSYYDDMCGNIEYIYEYTYEGCDRVESAFYQMHKSGEISIQNY